MKPDFFRIGEVLLFSLSILLLFLLIFESLIILPAWLQPLGRMHPLILHFPIAFLILVLILDYLRHHPSFAGQEFFSIILRYLFLIAVLLSSLSALTGLFLSLEDGYASEALFLHKWSALILVFLSIIVYYVRSKVWYSKKIAASSAAVVIVVLIIAGHLGSTLTHGENFILEPLTRNKNTFISLDEALVFDHAVLTVFEKKCISCHNVNKSKGELVLNRKERLLKGGASGALFVPGDPENSLLIQRIHLPIDDDEHMPPKGKTQLTDEEKTLIELWVARNASFEQRIVQLPDGDPLRQIATAYLSLNDKTTAQYDFPKADSKLLASLRNENRVIQALYKNSPALDVVFFNGKDFVPSDVEDLLVVKRQVVSLNLNHMPVEDDVSRIISQFENLEKLNLGFTRISGNFLESLGSLKKLKHISLSGTHADYTNVRNFIHDHSSLRSVALWNSNLSDEEISKLKAEYSGIQILHGIMESDEDILQLNPPVLTNPSKIFRDSLIVQLGHPIRDVEIRFTLDGSDPDDEKAITFVEGKTILTQGQLIKARAYKEGWMPSEIANLQVFRSRYVPDTVVLLSKLNRVHPANGALTFFDEEMGTFNANSPAWANNWAGFLRNDMEVLIEYKEPVLVSSVAMNILVEPETIIFPPISIEIWGGQSATTLQPIGQLKPRQPKQEGKPYIELIECQTKAFEGTHFKIIARSVPSLPDWHKRKGAPALLLVDELFVN
ncbi:MAG: cytochrome C [Cyclobacteriaceae bacterium]|nr:cytochrome C [Cyclobacteriaceae bacterium]